VIDIGEMDVNSAIIDGALSRLRPVLMTAFIAALGFVPMAIS
jgi:heavy metal efflux system protein